MVTYVLNSNVTMVTHMLNSIVTMVTHILNSIVTMVTLRYIIIKLDGFPPGKVTIEDNRHETDAEDLPDVDYSDVAFSEDSE